MYENIYDHNQHTKYRAYVSVLHEIHGRECGPSLDQFSLELKLLHLSGLPHLLPQSPT